MATIKKAQAGITAKKPVVKVVEKKTTVKVTPKKTFKTNPDSGGVAPFDKNSPVLPLPGRAAKNMPKQKNGGPVKKAKTGGSFPDLNKDGKITKADILKGRGVIAKKGAKIAKCKYGCK
jgi:hypothetical protein